MWLVEEEPEPDATGVETVRLGMGTRGTPVPNEKAVDNTLSCRGVASSSPASSIGDNSSCDDGPSSFAADAGVNPKILVRRGRGMEISLGAPAPEDDVDNQGCGQLFAFASGDAAWTKMKLLVLGMASDEWDLMW